MAIQRESKVNKIVSKAKTFIEIFVSAVLMGSGFVVGMLIVSKIAELF